MPNSHLICFLYWKKPKENDYFNQYKRWEGRRLNGPAWAQELEINEIDYRDMCFPSQFHINIYPLLASSGVVNNQVFFEIRRTLYTLFILLIFHIFEPSTSLGCLQLSGIRNSEIKIKIYLYRYDLIKSMQQIITSFGST